MAHRHLFRFNAILVATLALGLAACGSQNPTPTPPEPSLLATQSPTALATPTATPSPSPSPTPVPLTPITAVAGFRSQLTDTDAAKLAAILAGTDKSHTAIELVSSDATPIMAALGLSTPSVATRLVLAQTYDALAADLDKHSDRIGVVRASQVGPSVRALSWQGKSLFGVARVSSLAEWPLQAQLPLTSGSGADASASPSALGSSGSFDPSDLWTAAAGGDVMLDRGVYKVVKIQGKGIDFPWNGGSATITSRKCCTTWDWVYPIAKRTDTQPLVKQMLSGADISMLNLEGPAPVSATYHASGKAFTFQQSFLPGLKNAGIDVVSLANNHIGNAGSKGVRQTTDALDKIGIAHTGAAGSASAAAQPAMFTVSGVKVAVIGVSAFGYALAASLAGAPAEIKAARAAGAQVVIVYPHWGAEYKITPTSSQRTWAHRLIDAGADVVIGNHAHYVAGMEVYKGKPIWYALGNFVFDQTWSEQTEEGLLLELTFDGTRLVQVWVHPLLIMDGAQPNFLDAASGKPILDQMYKGSGKYLSW